MRASIVWLMIGIVLVGMFTSVFAVYITKMDAAFPQDQARLSNFSSYNRMTEMDDNVQEIEDDLIQLKESNSLLDKVEALFGSAYNVLLLIPKSMATGIDLTSDAIEDSELGDGLASIRTAMVIILSIMIFVGIILAILLKAEL